MTDRKACKQSPGFQGNVTKLAAPPGVPKVAAVSSRLSFQSPCLHSRLLLLATMGSRSGCVSAPLGSEIKSGEAAYAAMDATSPTYLGTAFKIGVQDTISVRTGAVFNIRAIRSGQAATQQFGRDIVVVASRTRAESGRT